MTPNPAKIFLPVTEEERNRILSPLPKHKAEVGSYVPLPQETETTFKKSRSQPAEDESESAAKSSATKELRPPADLRPVEFHRLPPRLYRIVDHLFPCGRPPRGQVTFQDFGRFMVALGFGQNPVDGSEYRFSREGDEVREDQSLVVHKRHPDPAYRAHDLRRIGRRLSARFGWRNKTFKLA